MFKMKIFDITSILDHWASHSLQEDYDNAGLLSGDPEATCTGTLCCLDITQKVLMEALETNCNLVVSHHPIIFKPLKSLAGDSMVNKLLIFAIKNNLAILSTNRYILDYKKKQIGKLYTYVPKTHYLQVRKALFEAGAGKIGLYENCSFSTSGTGTFRPMEGANPYIGTTDGLMETVEEIKLEVVFPIWMQQTLLTALQTAHPYETVAYEMVSTENIHQDYGSGIIGNLTNPLSETEFISQLKTNFSLSIIKSSPLLHKKVQKIALCGGAGSFLIPHAIRQGADVLVSSDLKYHDYFEADGKILLVDIGHYESEVATIELMADYISSKFPNFAVLKTSVITNPVQYFT
jgi:dinuclear metal center YbgI/SA1388 family protein